MVRQATETAVKASISTPVLALTVTRARTTRPGRAGSGSMSTVTCEIGSGWQSGISSCVRLAAMMPAMRAAPSTSPFLASPLSTMSSVLAVIATRPSATATRSVTALAPTSTMRASPRRPRWVSRAFAMTSARRGGDVLAREQRARCRRHVVLAHQALADQKRRDAGAGKTGDIGRRKDAALGHDHALARDERRQSLARAQARFEGLEVAVVDADEARAQAQRALELGFVVHLDECVHAERKGCLLEIPRSDIVDGRHDDEDTVGPPRARLDDLVGVVQEILAQDRKRGARAGQRRRVEIGADHAFRRACLLDLGDQRVVAAVEPALDGGKKSARGTGGLRLLDELRQRTRTL